MNNLHPLFVHFPIALLTLYSLLELVPDKKFEKIQAQTINVFLLVVGIIGSFLSLASGETAEHLYPNQHQLIKLHSTFADITVWLYGIITATYLIVLFTRSTYWNNYSSRFKILNVIQKIAFSLYKKPIRIILAVVGLVAISITGALGGAITHGPDVDSVVKFVYNLFF